MGGPHGSGRASRDRWIVSFGGIGDREVAEGLRSRVLLAPPIQDSGVVWVHQLIGSEVLDASGTRLGVVAAVDANPASDLLVLEDGGLVPMCFMTRQSAGTVVVDIPAGLLD